MGREDQAIKVTPDSQDSKVLLVSPVLRVLTVCPVPQVAQELQVDQESLVHRDRLVHQERKVRQVEMGFQDQLESKEKQEFQVTVVQVLLEVQDCQVSRETQVLLVLPATLVFPALKETQAHLVALVNKVPLAFLGLLGCLCQALKVPQDPLDYLEEQVHLAYKVLVDSQELVALREKRVLLACLEFLASPDRREILVFQEIRAYPVLLAPLE